MRIYHHEDPFSLTMRVAFLTGPEESPQPGDVRCAYNFATGKIINIYENTSSGTVLPKECFMEIPLPIWSDMLKAFAELASGKGIKLESDLKREGQLEATKYHLEDMRKLLKLKD